MPDFLSNPASQQTAFVVLAAITVFSFSAALLLRWRPSLHVPRPPRAVLAPFFILAVAASLALFFALRPLDVASLRTITWPHLSMPTLSWPSWHKTDQQLADLAALFCQLKLEERAISISQVDQCVALAKENPDPAYNYITRDNLGAPWDHLSDNEKSVAVDKARQDAAALFDALQLADSLGVPATRLPNPPPRAVNDLYLR